jgi:hypothetical protein
MSRFARTLHPSTGPASLILAISLVAVGCNAAAATSSPSATSAPSSGASTPTSSLVPHSSPTEVVCVVNEGDFCAGPLTAGTNSSAKFNPAITFTVPDGWANHEDTIGSYVLYTPSSVPPATDGGTRDWVAFLRDVVAIPPDCKSGPSQSFDANASAADIAAWMAGRAHLVTTTPKPVNVGGLNGLVLDIRLADGAPPECSDTVPGVALIHGLGPTDGYDQGIGAGSAMRFYFFDYKGAVMAIEIDDVSGGQHLDDFASILKTLTFHL